MAREFIKSEAARTPGARTAGSTEDPGWVYVLSNSAHAHLLKIGSTRNDPDARARELTGTGIPRPYLVEFKVMVANCAVIEAEVHADLWEYRDAFDREFFNVPLHVAVNRILDRLIAAGADRNGLFAYLRHDSDWVTPRSTPSIFDVLGGSRRVAPTISGPVPGQMTPVIDRRGKSSSSSGTTWVPLWGSENDAIWHQADEIYELVAQSELDSMNRFHVRIYRKGEQLELATKSVSEKTTQRHLTQADWEHLQLALERAQFWTLPKHQISLDVLDGHTWTIEGRRGDRTHVASYTNAPTSGPFYELGRLFFELADTKQ